MAGKALFQIVIDAKTGLETLVRVRDAMRELGETSEESGSKMTKQERDMMRLIDKLEPARVATERLTQQQQLLKDALVVGKFGEGTQAIDRYKAALETLNNSYREHNQSAGGLSAAIDAFKASLTGATASAAAYLAILAGIGKGGLEVTKAAAESELIEARRNATWKASQQTNQLTIRQLDEMASKISHLTGVHDEEVKQAEALAMTYHNIVGPAFERVMLAATNLAAVRGGELSDWISKLGRAMENPESGFTALTRAGVVFTTQQKDMIKALAQTGDTLGAMNEILSKIEEKYGGAAQTLSTTTVVEWKRMQAAVHDFKIELGQLTLDPAKEALSALRQPIEDLTDNFKRMRAAWREFWESIGEGKGVGGALSESYKARRGLSDEQLTLGGPPVTPREVTFGNLLSQPGAGLSATYSQIQDAAMRAFEAGNDAADRHKKHIEELKQKYEEMKKEVDALKTHIDKTWSTIVKPDWMIQGQMSSDVERAVSGLGDAIGLSLGTGIKTNITHTFAGLAPEVESTGFSAAFAQHIGVATSAGVVGGIVSGIERGVPEAMPAFSSDFANAFKDGILTTFESGDIREGWKALSAGFSGMFAESLGKALTSIFSGESTNIEGAAQAAGLWTPGTQGKSGSFNWGAALGMVGGLASQMSGANRLMGALGMGLTGAGLGFALGGGGAAAGAGASAAAGAATGAAAGSSFPVVGTIIGAVLGLIAGYFLTPGPQSSGYHAWIGTAERGRKAGMPTGVDIGGQSDQQQDELRRQMVQSYTKFNEGFREMLFNLDQSFPDMSKFTFEISGKTQDVTSMWRQILAGELPRSVLQYYRPGLEAGLGGIGVSQGRAGQLLSMFNTRTFEEAISALNAYIGALMRLQDIHKDVTKSLDDLRKLVTESVIETWRRTADDSLKEIERLSKGLDQLTNDEQVQRAQQIADITQKQYESNLQMLAQLEQLSQSITTSFAATFAGFREAEAQEQGPEAQRAFYQTEMLKAAEQMKAATGPEQLQQLMTLMLQYGQKLWQVGGEMPAELGGGGVRAWVEQFLKDQEVIAQGMIAQWQQEIVSQNEALAAAVNGMITALTSETSVRDDLLSTLGDENAAHLDLTHSLIGARGAVDDFAAALADAQAGWQ